jgi:endonuclease I
MYHRGLKYILALCCWLSITLYALSQPAGYYSSASGKTGVQLQQALHDIIANHTVLTYADLWTSFQKTDRKSDGTVWDMYSDKPGGTPAYVFIFGQNQCGNYSKEGDCYNREHSFPKSWFNDLSPMYTDLNHLVPTDGWVNNKRGNYPFGVTSSPTWTSTNGSRLGPSCYPGYTGVVFEPVNGYKGDFARIILYMAVRYYGEDSGWLGSDMVTGSQPKSWALKMLMEWSKNDPVSQKEKDRNDSVYVLQHNRNPFIDNAAYADQIWGVQSSTEHFAEREKLKIFPNPSAENVTIDCEYPPAGTMQISLTDISGRVMMQQVKNEFPVQLRISSLPEGVYIVTVNTGNTILRERIVISR